MPVRVIVFGLGTCVVVATLLSAIRTVVLPRAAQNVLTTFVFVGVRRLFSLRLRFAHSYADRDRVMAMYAPLAFLTLPGMWLLLICLAYAAMFWATGFGSVGDSLAVSGSSMFTLGFVSLDTGVYQLLGFTEASLGLGALALLITYLPGVYQAFSRREALVAQLEVRADSPASAARLLWRYTAIHGLLELEPLWTDWERWFAEVEETHTTLPALVFFRSPRPERSWVVAAGAVLDAASITCAAVRSEREAPAVGGVMAAYSGARHPRAALCIRAGFVCLRHIADFFGIEAPDELRENDPEHTDRISVTREEFDRMWEVLADAGTPLVEDRDQAWVDFAGWRVNYDAVLLALCALTMAPEAPWSSDRAPPFKAPKLFRPKHR